MNLDDMARILSDYVIPGTYVGLSLAGAMIMYRLIRGPSLLDRVLCIELLAAMGAGFIAVIAIDSDQSFLIDVALAVALVAFVGTVAFSRFLEIEARDE